MEQSKIIDTLETYHATARGRRRSWEARRLTELIEVTHKSSWRANRHKLYPQAYNMGVVDMTSSGSRIVLENSLGACSRLSTGQASNPTPFACPTRPCLLLVQYLTTVRSQSSRPFTLVRSQFFLRGTTVQLLLTLLQNPWPPKSPWSPLSTRLEPSPAISSSSSTHVDLRR